MNFGEALEALKQGKLIRRSFYAEGCFVFMQIPSEIQASVVPKMQSLPARVKKAFEKLFDDPSNDVNSIKYYDQFGFANSDGEITAWMPLPHDCLAEDWELFE